MQYLGEAAMKEENKVAKTLIFKVAGAQSIHEIQMETKFLQKASYLTIFVHRKGANDDILATLGECCPHLKVRFCHLTFTLWTSNKRRRTLTNTIITNYKYDMT